MSLQLVVHEVLGTQNTELLVTTTPVQLSPANVFRVTCATFSAVHGNHLPCSSA